MSDTPETDKQWAEFLNKLEKPIDVFVDFARKLERERNEAREDAKRATYWAAQETIKVSTVKSHWIEAIRERDELLDKLQRLAKILEQADEEYGCAVGGKADILATAIEEAVK